MTDLDVARLRWQAADRARGDHPLWCGLCAGTGVCARYARLAKDEREAWHALRQIRGAAEVAG